LILFLSIMRRPPTSSLFPYTTLFRSLSLMFGRTTLGEVHVPVLMYSGDGDELLAIDMNADALARKLPQTPDYKLLAGAGHFVFIDRKSTRLNSSHVKISYAVFCLKKK